MKLSEAQLKEIIESKATHAELFISEGETVEQISMTPIKLLAQFALEAIEYLKYVSKTDIAEKAPDTLWLNEWRNTRKEYAQNILNKYWE